MRRKLVLGTLIAAGTLSLAVAAAQQPPAPMVIEVEKLKDNLFVLRGGGGNTAVFVQANGVTVVDTKNPGWGQPLLEKIKDAHQQAGDDDHQHAHARDHVSGNVEFPPPWTSSLHENTAANMKKMAPVTAPQPPVNVFAEHGGHGLPKRTFKDTMTLWATATIGSTLHYFGRATPMATPGSSSRRCASCTPATSSRARTFRCSTTTTAAAAWRFQTR